jgi:hypothetical protein
MKRIYLISAFVLVTMAGCKKDNGPRLSGTDTIDNKLYGTTAYYAYGFSIPTGSKVSTLNSPIDVFTINAFPGNFNKTYFDAQNFSNSFYRYGVYPDAATASQAFINLTTFSVSGWKATGDSVKANQIWLFKTSSETYAKFRIISTVGEVRDIIPYVECTFEWVHQPNGTLTFPGK